MAIWRVLSIWNSVTSPSLWKNPGHAPVEEKEIAELSKKESVRWVQRLSQQNKNRMVIP